jgi:hypothetical protein
MYLFIYFSNLSINLFGRVCSTFAWFMTLNHVNRRTQGIQTSSISTLVKRYGLMGGTTLTGLHLSWQFWTQEWVICKTMRENQSLTCMLTSSWHWKAIDNLYERGSFAAPHFLCSLAGCYDDCDVGVANLAVSVLLYISERLWRVVMSVRSIMYSVDCKVAMSLLVVLSGLWHGF